MAHRSFIVIGGTGLFGSAVVAHLRGLGADVLALDSKKYGAAVGQTADVLVNCNGNTFRYKAIQDPPWDFQASVASVHRSLFDFRVELYIYLSTIDVYQVLRPGLTQRGQRCGGVGGADWSVATNRSGVCRGVVAESKRFKAVRKSFKFALASGEPARFRASAGSTVMLYNSS